MTKRDYQAIARAFYEAADHMSCEEEGMWNACVRLVGDVLQADNARFDRNRFEEACETGTTRGMRKEGR
jgi:hypothetical protein